MTLRSAGCALSFALALASCTDKPPAGYPGYAEGEYVRVASPLAGTLLTLAVARGAQIAKDVDETRKALSERPLS